MRRAVCILMVTLSACVGGIPTDGGYSGDEPGTCPRIAGFSPALGCTYVTGQLLRLDGSAIPFSSVSARYVLPGVYDSLRFTLSTATDGSGRFALSDVVSNSRPASAPPAANLPLTLRLYANSGWSSTNPVDSLDIVAQFTIAGAKPPPTNIIWKTAKVR